MIPDNTDFVDFDDTDATGITCIDHHSLSRHHMSWEALVSRLVKEIDDSTWHFMPETYKAF